MAKVEAIWLIFWKPIEFLYILPLMSCRSLILKRFMGNDVLATTVDVRTISSRSMGSDVGLWVGRATWLDDRCIDSALCGSRKR